MHQSPVYALVISRPSFKASSLSSEFYVVRNARCETAAQSGDFATWPYACLSGNESWLLMQKVNGSSTTATSSVAGQEKVLLAKKEDLLIGLRGNLETFVTPENAAAEDWAPLSHDQSVASHVNRIEFSQLKLIDQALERIRTEEYGICHECGEPIPTRRLDAIPWAIRCVPCEQQFAETAAAFVDDQLAA